MHRAYFETRFRVETEHEWPHEFVIISACATTGTRWSSERTAKADAALRATLAARGLWHVRITGFSPATEHAEPSWAIAMPFLDACDLGREFLQDAIYHVEGDALSVSHCDERRGPMPVGRFRERVVVGAG